jgi:hypothetical protein
MIPPFIEFDPAYSISLLGAKMMPLVPLLLPAVLIALLPEYVEKRVRPSE